ncbi:hypothetical protein [Salibacter halophilus]|uniref:DUF4293 family protein n=1 Tax=Salibacter halophilus TaxID=1803916 RepID=A0A6N6M4H1_9FLAO|nr:hypothetical protein [Salibacter halophilus]KAB1064369.1 hypothetical protein F3059_06610 [Salibacter halophilus]
MNKVSIQRKAITLLLNAATIITLIYLQNQRYANIANLKFDGPHDDVLKQVGFMQAGGNDINWIICTALILLVFNMIIYRKWIKAKHWIFEPFIILIITLIMSVAYHSNRMSEISKDLKENHNSVNY